MPRRKRDLKPFKAKEEKRREKLVRVFESILSERNTSSDQLTSLQWVDGFILIEDKDGAVRSIPDIEKEMYFAIVLAPPVMGQCKKFDKHGKLDRFA